MLIEPETFAEHLAGAPEGAPRAAYEAFARAAYPAGLTVRASSNGFLAHELRIEAGENWYFAAVLKDDWVVFYFRKPSLRDGLVEAEALQAAFPGIHRTPKGELSLRIGDEGTAARVIAALGAPR